jgi:hypothetical protein
MTASMYHSIIKILATFRASSLPVQQTHYTMDLFDPFDDLSPVDEKIYQKLVGMLIWTMKLRIETQLAVIMACFHNSNPTQGDQTKVIRLLAYFSGCQDLGPTWHTTEGPILVASCDAAFAMHLTTGGSQFSISYRIGSDNAPFHVISKIQTTEISLNPTHSEYNAFSIATWSGLDIRRRILCTRLQYPHSPKLSEELQEPACPKNRNVRAAYRDQILTPFMFSQRKAMQIHGLPGQESRPPQHQSQP